MNSILQIPVRPSAVAEAAPEYTCRVNQPTKSTGARTGAQCEAPLGQKRVAGPVAAIGGLLALAKQAAACTQTFTPSGDLVAFQAESTAGGDTDIDTTSLVDTLVNACGARLPSGGSI